MRKYKTGCFICGKETRASRYGITERSIDVCYECHKNKPTSLNNGESKMRTQDIKIGETYRHRTSPNYGYAKALKIVKPNKDNFWKTEDEKTIKVVAVRCKWSTYKNDTFGLIKYFRPCDLIEVKQ